MTNWTRRIRWVERHDDVLFDLVRIYLGVGLFLKAIYFLTHRDYLISVINSSGDAWIVPAAVAHVVILAHLAGGLSLAFGLVTRAGALVQIPVLLAAVFRVHLPRMASIEERQNVEFSALVLFLLVLISLRGGGPLSLDSKMEKRAPA
jgi:uncharacterized membrane protein YphA (DoxX/SURF4 family)